MGMARAVRQGFGRYATFEGRSSRPDFWWFSLFVFAGAIGAEILSQLLWRQGLGGPHLLRDVFVLATVLPLIAAACRRLHDCGKPGWWLIMPLALSVLTMVLLFGGVAGFSFLERFVSDREVLRAPAAVLGGVGLTVAALLQAAILVLLVWWLSRPGDMEANRFGPPSA